MKLYGQYIKKYRLPFLTAVLCVTLEAFCDLLGPTLMANIINDGIQKNDLENVLHWGLLMLLVTAAGACFAITRNVLASRVSQRIGADLRRDLFAKILRFSEASADKIESGSLITRMTNDTSQVTQFINGIMRIFLKAPVTCIGSILLATGLNPRLSFIIYGVVFLVSFFIFISMKLSYPRFSKLQQAMDRVNSVVQEYLIGVRLVKAFGTYEEEEQRFGTANGELMRRGVSAQIIITFISPLMTLTVGLGTMLVILLGSRLFAAGLTGAGDISALTIYMAQILSSLLIITNVFNTFVRTKASSARISEVFQCGEDFRQGEKISQTDQGPQAGECIAFDHVTFAYPNGSGIPVLTDLTFSVQEGQSLAIIGPTGSGKSTIAWLLLRFYDPAEGRIFLSGRDLRQLPTPQIRQSIAIAPQRPMLFSGTVEENIRWGNPAASAQQLEDALRTAQVDFTDRMASGIHSPLSGGGVNLSGGQKQRLSIARALLRKAPVLILDDAVSALDSVTEAKVRSGLSASQGSRTVITITQKCSTAMFSDRILVLENGICAGFGTHSQLMEHCKMYQDIYHSQMEGGKEAQL